MDQDPKSAPQLKILLVENSRTARAVLSRQLQQANYAVDAVGSGLEALEAIVQGDYHLVIMDVFLPQMNGYEAAQRIRSLDSDKANTFVLALSSSTSETDKKTCLDAGINEYIIKTADNEALFSAIKKYSQAQL